MLPRQTCFPNVYLFWDQIENPFQTESCPVTCEQFLIVNEAYKVLHCLYPIVASQDDSLFLAPKKSHFKVNIMYHVVCSSFITGPEEPTIIFTIIQPKYSHRSLSTREVKKNKIWIKVVEYAIIQNFWQNRNSNCLV